MHRSPLTPRGEGTQPVKEPPFSRAENGGFFDRLYAEGVAGLLIEEFTGKDMHDPQKAADYFALILESSVPGILKSAAAH